MNQPTLAVVYFRWRLWNSHATWSAAARRSPEIIWNEDVG